MTTLLEANAMTDLADGPATNPMVVYLEMAKRGIGADQLRIMSDVAKEWQERDAERQFSESMHACQEAMPRVVKDAKNTQTKSTYAKLEHVQQAARPIYSAHGFSLSYGEADCPTAGYKRTVCDVRHVGGAYHSYHLDLPIDGIGPKGNPIGGMNAVQGCISTTSYAQRRLLCMIFNITIADEDDDGQAAAKISEKEIAILNEWITESGADLFKFLQYMGVDSLADIPARDMTKAVSALQLKRQQQATK